MAPDTGIECETFHKLEAFVSTEDFLVQLQKTHRVSDPRCAEVTELINDAMSRSITGSLQALPPASATTFTTAGTATSDVDATSEGSLPEDYVVIDRQSAIEAMAFFIAETLMKCPQAYAMTPRKLQEGVIIAIQGMKQSRFKQVCTAGRHAYRWGALGYSAFQMYSNPWICQAIITAIFTFSRMTMRSWI